MAKEMRIAVFVSGNGSNLENIFNHFEEVDGVSVDLMVTSKDTCMAVERALRLGVPWVLVDKEFSIEGEDATDYLKEAQIDWIVLAGFLKKIPEALVNAYNGRIVNIHPALLPKFGGPGMYGRHVHNAVSEAGETESGISIHMVNEEYDEGAIVFQAKCSFEKHSSPEEIESLVRQLEIEHYPIQIEKLIANEL